LDLTPKEPPPPPQDDKLDNNKGKSESNTDRDKPQLPDEK